MLLKCGKGKQTYQIYHNKLRRWAKAVTYMVNGNSYPLGSLLWIIAAENDSCRPRRGRVVATSEGDISSIARRVCASRARLAAPSSNPSFEEVHVVDSKHLDLAWHYCLRRPV